MERFGKLMVSLPAISSGSRRVPSAFTVWSVSICAPSGTANSPIASTASWLCRRKMLCVSSSIEPSVNTR